MKDKPFHYRVNGELHFYPEGAISYLIENLHLFTLEETTKNGEERIVVLYMYNDLFFDGECGSAYVNFSDIQSLTEYVLNDNIMGSLVWMCFKENMKPQSKVVKEWKESGIWNEKLENLPNNSYEEKS